LNTSSDEARKGGKMKVRGGEGRGEGPREEGSFSFLFTTSVYVNTTSGSRHATLQCQWHCGGEDDENDEIIDEFEDENERFPLFDF
jgi:hypothetical protein